MWIVDKKVRKGLTNYVVQNDLGEQRELKGDVLKAQVRLGKVTISNAKLSTNGHFYMLKNVKVPKPTSKKGVKEYKRTPSLQKMTIKEKVEYYFGTLLGKNTLLDMSVFTVDELECILLGSIDLEIIDQGSNMVDMVLSNNIHAYGAVNAVIKECVRREYLTEEECKEYLVGCDKDGRVYKHYTFAEWIMKHKKN